MHVRMSFEDRDKSLSTQRAPGCMPVDTIIAMMHASKGLYQITYHLLNILSDYNLQDSAGPRGLDSHSLPNTITR